MKKVITENEGKIRRIGSGKLLTEGGRRVIFLLGNHSRSGKGGVVRRPEEAETADERRLKVAIWRFVVKSRKKGKGEVVGVPNIRKCVELGLPSLVLFLLFMQRRCLLKN